MWVVFREFALGLVPPAALVGFALGSILLGLDLILSFPPTALWLLHYCDAQAATGR